MRRRIALAILGDLRDGFEKHAGGARSSTARRRSMPLVLMTLLSDLRLPVSANRGAPDSRAIRRRAACGRSWSRISGTADGGRRACGGGSAIWRRNPPARSSAPLDRVLALATLSAWLRSIDAPAPERRARIPMNGARRAVTVGLAAIVTGRCASSRRAPRHERRRGLQDVELLRPMVSRASTAKSIRHGPTLTFGATESIANYRRWRSASSAHRPGLPADHARKLPNTPRLTMMIKGAIVRGGCLFAAHRHGAARGGDRAPGERGGVRLNPALMIASALGYFDASCRLPCAHRASRGRPRRRRR